MTLRCSMLVAALATAVCQGAQAQTIDRLDLDYRSAQARLLERSDAIQGADADVRSKEAQKGSTSTLRRPTVEFEGQMIRYQKTLYLPLGPLADVAQDYAIYDPLRFEIERTSTRPQELRQQLWMCVTPIRRDRSSSRCFRRSARRCRAIRARQQHSTQR